MEIVVRLDVMLALRKMKARELAARSASPSRT
jgi:DNA-binding Xre family transcriptional regulator